MNSKSLRPTVPSRAAFSLVELLVVMAIIAILISILLSITPTIRERGRLAVCTKNLKQIHSMMMVFVADNDGMFHPSPNGGLWENSQGTPLAPNQSSAYWGVAYAGNQRDYRKQFNCPSMTVDVDDWVIGIDNVEPFKDSCYGLNRYINNRVLSQWTRPSTVIVAQDATEQVMDGFGTRTSSGEIVYDTWNDTLYKPPGHRWNLNEWRTGGRWFHYTPEPVRGWFRHRGQCNTLWLDGHTSLIAETEGDDIDPEWYIGSNPVQAIWK